LSMVMANKWILNETTTPLFFLGSQLLIAVVLFMISDALRLLPDRLTFNLEICKGLAPMVTLNIFGLGFSNYTLKYVDASFYQVARGLVLPFTVCTSYFVLHARPSLRILLSCAIVSVGFFVGVFLDGTQVSPLGVCFGVASSVITALHSVVIKRSLNIVNGSALLLSWYQNAICSILMVPVVILAGEGPDVLKLFFGVDELVKEPGSMSTLRKFLWGTAFTGILGFTMSIASLLSIKVTSPITHMISSAVRGVAATFLGAWIFHDIVKTGRASSIAFILLGSIYYTWVKNQESQTNTPPSNKGNYERVPMKDVESGAYNRKESKPE